MATINDSGEITIRGLSAIALKGYFHYLRERNIQQHYT
nr:MAG TPA: alpha-N-acetylgalactosaminidase domain-containing protein [Caudoviricetes sp.]